MEDFIPSVDFIKNTMLRIETSKVHSPIRLKTAFVKHGLQIVGLGAATLIAVANLIRLFATVYAPVICH